MAASVTTQEMYAMDTSMGTLGIERLSGGLYCDMSLCYGHLAMSLDWRPNCPPTPTLPSQMRVHCQSRTMGCSETGLLLLLPAAPAALIPVHSIYGTVTTPPPPKARSALISPKLGQSQIP